MISLLLLPTPDARATTLNRGVILTTVVQLLATIIDLTVKSDNGKRADQCGSLMSHFHLKLFSYIDMIWVNISQAGSDFLNVNVVTKHQPIGNINMSNYI
jgi:hypothetical protein